jgi:predicted MFS family arabinose efflux permease
MLVLSLYLQQVLHESPLLTGLIVAPQGVVGFSAGLLGPRLAARIGIRRLLVLTGAACAVGFVVPTTSLPAAGYSPILFVVMLIGFAPRAPRSAWWSWPAAGWQPPTRTWSAA